MANLKVSEVSDVLLGQLRDMKQELKFEEVGKALQVSDGVVRVYGLDNAESGELLDCGNGVMAVVMNLEPDNVGAVLMGPTDLIKEGAVVRRTRRIVSIPVGESLVGRVVDPLGNPLDGMGNIGGSACAIGLCMCIALFAKSQRYKALNKVSLPAGLVSISEPMVFGVPMVLNPVMLIPMLLAPTATFLLGYLAMATGIMPYMTGAELPNGTPVILGGFLAWGGIKGAIMHVVLIAVSTLIYYPFFKILDKQALEEEKDGVQE